MSEDQQSVFVSYARKDQQLASSVVELLRARNDVFYDIDSIPAGQRWRDALHEGIDGASYIYLLWCRHSAGSSEVAWEYEQAVEADKPVVPVLLDSTPVSANLADYQWVDFRPSYERLHNTTRRLLFRLVVVWAVAVTIALAATTVPAWVVVAPKTGDLPIAGAAAGRIFSDRDGNGIEDEADTGLSAVEITVTDSTGSTRATTTDADGNYMLQDIPIGERTITFTAPDHYTPSTDNATQTVTIKNLIVATPPVGYQPEIAELLSALACSVDDPSSPDQSMSSRSLEACRFLQLGECWEDGPAHAPLRICKDAEVVTSVEASDLAKPLVRIIPGSAGDVVLVVTGALLVAPILIWLSIWWRRRHSERLGAAAADAADTIARDLQDRNARLSS